MTADLQAFIDSLEDGVVIVDGQYRLRQLNRAIMRNLPGLGSGALGQVCCDVLSCHQHPCEEADSDCPARQVFATGHSARMTHFCEIDGRLMWSDVVASPLRDETGTVDQVVEVWRDISERKQLEVRYQRRVQELSALHLVSTVNSQSLSVREILDGTLDLVLEILQADAGGIYLFDEADETGKFLRLRAYRSISGEVAEDIDYLRLGEGFSGRVVQSGEPLVVDDVRTDPRLTRFTINKTEFRSLLSVPLKSNKGVIGTIWATIRQPARRFVDSERDWLTAVGGQVALAIENARLYEEVHQREIERSQLLTDVINAQEEERKRVARGLHDETNQALTVLSLKVDTLLAKWAPADAELRNHLQYLKMGIGHIMDNVQQVILDLRPGPLDDLGLVPALKWYARLKLEPLGMDVNFTVVGPCVHLGSELETTLFRVVQEAINNIAEHSGAHRVDVSIGFIHHSVTAAIVDDGRGFDVNECLEPKVSRRGLGLLGMRERLSLIGGKLDVQSRRQEGTRLRIEIPLSPIEPQGE